MGAGATAAATVAAAGAVEEGGSVEGARVKEEVVKVALAGGLGVQEDAALHTAE